MTLIEQCTSLIELTSVVQLKGRKMDFPAPDDHIPTFYIGQHESDRIRVTPELLHQAQDHNVSSEELNCFAMTS